MDLMSAPEKSGPVLGPLRCPFCDGTFTVLPERLSVLHSMPPCKGFVDVEPDEFLYRVRTKDKN